LELNRNNIVHELGHQFARNWKEKVGENINPNHPYYMYDSRLLTEDGWPDPPVGADLMWRQHPNSDEPKPKRESRTRYGSPKAREKGRSTKLSQRQLSLVHIVAECG
jgi:hypothetical protein